MSSNPFRKKALQSIDTTRPPSPAKSSLRSDLPLADGSSLRKSRPVKKVRVLSPPPLSPDSPEWPGGANRAGYGAPEYRDPLGPGWPKEGGRDGDATTMTPPVAAVWTREPGTQAVPPPNPFSRTLHDLENSSELESQRKDEGAALKAGNAARQSLNVDAFRRLLLTGKANDAEPPPGQSSAASGDASSSRATVTGDDDANSEEEEEEEEEEGDESSRSDSGKSEEPVFGAGSSRQADRDKKAPPPPPSSRHGRSLKDDRSDAPKPGTPTEVTKPVPPSPLHRSLDNEVESPFDGEPAGRVPFPDPAQRTEPDLESQHAQPGNIKRLAPAPPPRRGHSRTDSRGHPTSAPSSAESTPSKPRDEETPPGGTGAEEPPSRPGGPRHAGHGPLPPPPRRPHPTPRQTAPSSSSSSHGASSHQAMAQSPSTPTRHQEADPSLHAGPDASALHESQAAGTKATTPPRPPPTRKSSVKRPPSMNSVDGISRRVTGESRARDGAAPPPPPPRQRGGSSGSLDVLPRRTASASSTHSNRGQRPPLTRHDDEPGQAGGDDETAEPGKGGDILADLDALQREVDALRGKLG
ncbi:hypothetical protein CDD83_1492 [Cordyceps sp. RAO-2017]|nr:hypothetical protein CDD83_1492 [Cordyceps sp. RAO-2017]